MAQLSVSLMVGYQGYSMREICPHGYDDTDDSHCAHFVSHVLQLDFGVTCAGLVGHRGAAGSANVRVREIFARCPGTREVLECPTTGIGLIFVSRPSSFRGSPTRIADVSRKHIGIGINGMVWHYSNTRNRVIRQPYSQFLYHYPRQQNALWWGGLPSSAVPAAFGTSSL